jgi:hypothetical protein
MVANTILGGSLRTNFFVFVVDFIVDRMEPKFPYNPCLPIIRN